MIAVSDRREGWGGPSFLTPVDYSEPWLEQQLFIESEMALFLECRVRCAQNPLDRADIVREAIYRQPAEAALVSL